jgi:hypothetical protein
LCLQFYYKDTFLKCQVGFALIQNGPENAKLYSSEMHALMIYFIFTYNYSRYSIVVLTIFIGRDKNRILTRIELTHKHAVF